MENFDIRNEVFTISVKLEMAKAVLGEVLNGYFDSINPEPYMLAYSNARYGLLANVVLDYIVDVEKRVKEAGDHLNAEEKKKFEEEKGDAA